MQEPTPIYAEVMHDYICESFTEDEGDIKAAIFIDGAKNPDDEEMEVIAQVILSKRGDILVAWVDNGARGQENVLTAIAEAKKELAELRDESWENTSN